LIENSNHILPYIIKEEGFLPPHAKRVAVHYRCVFAMFFYLGSV
jgi:hypothetical protein